MNTAVINVKVDPRIKKKAQKVASELGFSLSSLINAYLRDIIRTKTVNFSAADENPSDYLIKSLKEAEKDIKAGRVSPRFDNANDATKWLNNPKKKYANQV
ncbi:MAG: Addiction module antitoxin, RelB/DinJ family [Candidatus Gottesmanbacteria bacterium GW2011_GWA2_41_12]|uniref:Addiction module antitoxin, RelB/DinJ family n=2 Tax=Candidatus Gottesmaniibacteriota TaxID=1752720 RepID=A0A0G0UL82_9BACT|nr:MAG: Addiction module antitoxin, RelB/DinJ family [Candidatus Gottesmanbacteria bacterium GW2011_GWC2_39_8]KKR88286.1 MAG: Addiction module antitoxin, RelB/DinJ family [Candidatus Gottesmanbacteria bacterium GW2011_GWA2_41_12]